MPAVVLQLSEICLIILLSLSLSWLDVSVLCILLRIVNECIEVLEIFSKSGTTSAVSSDWPLQKKMWTWFGRVCNFWNAPGNDWIVLAESEYKWQGIIIMVAEAPVNMYVLLGNSYYVSITSWWLSGCSIHHSWKFQGLYMYGINMSVQSPDYKFLIASHIREQKWAGCMLFENMARWIVQGIVSDVQ